MENIKEKLLKIKRLAEDGELHEAENARRHLERMLEKYGMNLGDLSDESRSEREFRNGNKFELMLLVVVCSKMVGDERTRESTYSPKAKVLHIMVTAYEYAEIRSMYDWHVSNFKRERSKMLKNIENAYIIKHGLYMDGPSDGGRKLSEQEKQEILEAVSMSRSLSDVYYRKQIGAGNEPD